MKRNMDLILAILEYVETNDKGSVRFLEIPSFDKYSEEEVVEHLELCHEAKYIAGQRTASAFLPRRLTSKGHDALSRMRVTASLNAMKKAYLE